MIRVALHVIAGPQGGPRTYGVALARALARRTDIETIVLTDQPDAFPGMQSIPLPRPKPWSDHVTVPRILAKLKPDVYHNTKNAFPIYLPCPGVVTIHDLAYVHFPETFTPAARSYIKVHTLLGAKRAQKIICVSEHARRDVAETLGVDDRRIVVAHHGVAQEYRRESFDAPKRLPKPYILSVGTIQARKNLDVFVRAAARLRTETDLEFTIAIAGRRGWKVKEFDQACKETPVVLLGEVPERDLPGLYAHAAAFVQPSSYEGFGLTAAEAMACGAPVIAADAGSLPEVVGDTGLLVPPRNEAALAAAMRTLLEDRDAADAMGLCGRERAQRFTWDRSAEVHARVYAEVARKTRKTKEPAAV